MTRSHFALVTVIVTVVGAVGVVCVRGRPGPTPEGLSTAAAAPSIDGSPQRPGPCTLTEAQVSIPVGDAEMIPICNAVYAEPGLTPAEVAELQRATEAARHNIARAFGQPARSASLILFCHSAACKVAFGAPASAAAARDLGFARDVVQTKNGPLERSTVIVTGPGGGTSRLLTHELVHAEMKTWVPYDSLPTWFNEGTATLVAMEPNCDGQSTTTDFEVTRLDTKQRWERHLRATGKTLETYCQARHRVAAWATRFEGDEGRAAALRKLLSSVAEGMAFERAYAL